MDSTRRCQPAAAPFLEQKPGIEADCVAFPVCLRVNAARRVEELQCLCANDACRRIPPRQCPGGEGHAQILGRAFGDVYAADLSRLKGMVLQIAVIRCSRFGE